MDTPTVLDGPTIGAGIVTLIGAIYTILGHNGLTDAESHAIVAASVVLYAVGALVYHAVKVHAFASGPAAFAQFHELDKGDGPPVRV